MKGYVYFIRAVNTYYLKIGWSSNPPKRLAALQTASPFPLEILGTVVGDKKIETEERKAASCFNQFGEWHLVNEDFLRDLLRKEGFTNYEPERRFIPPRAQYHHHYKRKTLSQKEKMFLASLTMKLNKEREKRREYWQEYYRTTLKPKRQQMKETQKLRKEESRKEKLKRLEKFEKMLIATE